MEAQTTRRASVAVGPSAAVVYLEGVDCPHCATAINPSYRVATPCDDPHAHAMTTVESWRSAACTTTDDYRVVDLVVVDQDDDTATITAARIAALRTRPITIYVDVIQRGRGLVTCGDGDFSGRITRQLGRYLVETESGAIIGHARTYRNGAEMLARHHRFPNFTIVIDHE